MKVKSSYGLLLLGTLIPLNDAFHVHQIDKRQQKDAIATPEIPPLRPLPWGDVNFLHTTDSHGWLEGHVSQGSYNGDLGDFYSFTVRMKEKAKKMKKDLFIVDTGDTHDGNGLSDITSPRGLLSQPLLTQIPYDLLTIGNHELYVDDITNDTLRNFIPHWKDKYLAANVYVKDANTNVTVPITKNKYTYFEGKYGTRVLAYGFLFNFQKNGKMSVIKSVEDEIKQPWFQKSLVKHKPDIIVLIGHMGLHSSEFASLIKEIRAHYPTIPITVFGGHTHIRDAAIYDPWAAGIQSGRYLETIGFFSLKYDKKTSKHDHHHPRNVTFARRYLDQNRYTYIHHSVDGKEKKFDTKEGKKITEKIQQLRKEYDLSIQLGCAPQDYKMSAVPPDDPSSVFYLLTREVLPKVVTEPQAKNPAYFLANSGSVRYDIDKGPFLIGNMYQLSPFEDYFYAIQNVPYDVVDKVLPLLNKEGEKMMKRNIQWLKDQSTADDADEITSLDRRTPITPGYVTVDDFGTDGDDTEHIPVDTYTIPAFIGSEIPKNDTGFVDIVYFDFIDNQLKALLQSLTGQTWTTNKRYGDPKITSSTIWIHFAEQYWNTTGSCF
ncbi:Metallo-dependent phosphatase-like protein [Mycotypha africana]|uniref:Metallo-dependent phosphatase-like protein n=1 Tax=Mycotypha africana TaxID=64632 RepID=UPI002301A784|nr:Metallo-dependent phosphatase-like protein [Mycotypha africana]KAI8979381.1 Metallo-dependent phosphatase-like protein [Mycotypha africana]